MTHDGRDRPADVTVPEGSTEAQVMAELRAAPFMRHGMIANSLAAQTVKCDGQAATAVDVGDAIAKTAQKVGSGDLQPITDILLSQGIMLDVTATEMMRRAWHNVGEYPEAFQRYMNLALKAQAQSRTALEVLSRMHQPREQIVRHVHVNEGGQAIVADQITINGPGAGTTATADQSDAQRTPVAALLGQDPLGNSVPIPSGAREAQMQDARRDQPRRASRKQERAKARPENI